jgi:hypothetical protein
MRSVSYCLLGSLALALAILPENAIAAESAEPLTFENGVAHKRPVDLTQSTFEAALNDPANPVWLLKFYAPWVSSQFRTSVGFSAPSLRECRSYILVVI